MLRLHLTSIHELNGSPSFVIYKFKHFLHVPTLHCGCKSTSVNNYYHIVVKRHMQLVNVVTQIPKIHNITSDKGSNCQFFLTCNNEILALLRTFKHHHHFKQF